MQITRDLSDSFKNSFGNLVIYGNQLSLYPQTAIIIRVPQRTTTFKRLTKHGIAYLTTYKKKTNLL